MKSRVPWIHLGDWPATTNTSSCSTTPSESHLGRDGETVHPGHPGECSKCSATPVYTDAHNPSTCQFCRMENEENRERYFRAASKPGERVRFEEVAHLSEPTVDELIAACGELEHDPVDNPAHYTEGFGGVEVIQLSERLNFCRGNVVKYVCRAGKKGGPEQEVEDLKKALWYLNRELFRLEAE